MAAILCYGDSNTWGFVPGTGQRMGRWERWPGVLQRELGDAAHVIEEGLSGRTTAFDVPFSPHRDGLGYLPVALMTHAPLDAVVISLGTNDVFLPGVNAHQAARGAMTLVETTRASMAGPEGGAPTVLVLIPPPFAPLGPDGLEAPGAERESKAFADAFHAIAARDAEWIGGEVPMLDLGGVTVSSPVDGIHFDVEAHRSIGSAVAEQIRGLLDLA